MRKDGMGADKGKRGGIFRLNYRSFISAFSLNQSRARDLQSRFKLFAFLQISSEQSDNNCLLAG